MTPPLSFFVSSHFSPSTSLWTTGYAPPSCKPSAFRWRPFLPSLPSTIWAFRRHPFLAGAYGYRSKMCEWQFRQQTGQHLSRKVLRMTYVDIFTIRALPFKELESFDYSRKRYTFCRSWRQIRHTLWHARDKGWEIQTTILFYVLLSLFLIFHHYVFVLLQSSQKESPLT